MSTAKLALLGGEPIGGMPTGVYPEFEPSTIRRVAELLQRGATVGLSKKHPEILEAETAIAVWQGMPYCLGTSSGHAALHSALMGLEIFIGRRGYHHALHLGRIDLLHPA